VVGEAYTHVDAAAQVVPQRGIHAGERHLVRPVYCGFVAALSGSAFPVIQYLQNIAGCSPRMGVCACCHGPQYRWWWLRSPARCRIGLVGGRS
jgi:hypothetical protein